MPSFERRYTIERTEAKKSHVPDKLTCYSSDTAMKIDFKVVVEKKCTVIRSGCKNQSDKQRSSNRFVLFTTPILNLDDPTVVYFYLTLSTPSITLCSSDHFLLFKLLQQNLKKC